MILVSLNKSLACCRLSVPLLSICLAACPARTVTPLAMSQPGDLDLNCSDLVNHIDANKAEASKLLDAQKGVEQANVGKVVVGSALVPIGLLIAASADMSSADQVQARAIVDRNQQLVYLAQHKGCQLP